MSRFSQQSPLRKLTDTGFFYLKKNGRFVFRDVATRTDSLVLGSLSDGTVDLYLSNLGVGRAKMYLQSRGLPDTEGVDLVRKDSHFSDGKAILAVRSFSRDGWKAGKYHALSMTRLVTNRDSPEKKMESFRNIDIRCTDPRSAKQLSYEPPQPIARMFGCSAPIDTVYCTHAEIGYDWLSVNHGVYGFGMNPPSFTHKVIAYVAEQVVKRNQRLSKYRLNEQFRREKTEIFEPLVRMAWRGQISPL